ncbi:lachesin-like Protein [Elysia marginata]|uniref:Lachesin-like Protein n=1 Tax=Elysia marginata TaxID=1093978 RepID=A0AAV4HXW7_9GAST|nr:lachesin-like Protein [Elysia marginata]
MNGEETLLQAASNYDELLGIVVPNPVFLPGTTNITVREGADVQLPCSVRNLGTKKVAWRLIQQTARFKKDRFLTIGKMTWSEDDNISLDHSR